MSGGGGGVVVMIVVRRPLFRPSLKIRSKSDQNYFRNRKKNSKIEFDKPFQTCNHRDSFELDLDLVAPVQTDQNMNSFPAVMSAHAQTLQQQSQHV